MTAAEDMASVTRFVLDHVKALPTPGLMQSDACRVQLLTRTEDPIAEARGAAKRAMSQTPPLPEGVVGLTRNRSCRSTARTRLTDAAL